MIPTVILVLNTNKKENAKNRVQFIKVTEDMVTVVNRRERVLSNELISKISTVYGNKESIKGFSETVNLVLLQSLKIKYKVYNPSCS